VCFRRPIDAALLQLAPQVRFVQQLGAGYDNLDLTAIEAAGVQAANNPGWNTVTVAEHTLLLMLAVLRRFLPAAMSTSGGHFPTMQVMQEHQSRIGELQGTGVGLVGFGAIGQAVAQRLAGFGAQVTYTARHRVDEATETRLNASYLRLDELLRGSQILSLHLPLSESTRHLIGTAELEALPVGAVIINTSRGGLIDEDALRRALESGHLSGAALDVLEAETEDVNAFADMPQVIVTPHLAGTSAASFPRALQQAVANIGRYLRGEPVQHLLTRA
jgi:phosphoglycerate dehydrogenase-like enzyme